MKHENISDFIKGHLRFEQHWRKKHIDMCDAKWQTLAEDTFIGDSSYRKGSQFKVFETRNFGWIVFTSDTKTADGLTSYRRILKW
jgi:hypothetical protein